MSKSPQAVADIHRYAINIASWLGSRPGRPL
jgi:hypothetical protein